MTAILRQACIEDIPSMHIVRLAVRENALRSSVITEASYLEPLTCTGRGWVIEESGQILAFAVGNVDTGNIWALFVHPAHEGKNFGRRLHDTMVDYLFASGIQHLNLNTASGTRAQRFYTQAGWQLTRIDQHGEAFFELQSPLG